MALTEKDVFNWTITENRCIEVLKITIIYRDGTEISRVNHRHVLAPGDLLDGQHSEVIATANALWTPEVIQEYQDLLAANVP
jgi:hypothetical protein